jgi:hypothetical protein
MGDGHYLDIVKPLTENHGEWKPFKQYVAGTVEIWRASLWSFAQAGES